MSLYKRLHDVQQSETPPAEPAATPPASGSGAASTPPSGLAAAHAAKGTGLAGRRDPMLDELRQRIHHSLIEELGPILYDSRLSEEELRKKVHEQLHAALAHERAPLSAADKAQLIQDVSDDILGYGPIDPLLRDDDVSEIMCNGPDSIYVERDGKLTKDPITFVDEAHLRRIIDKIVGQVGRRIDESTPMCDARLPDGSRVNAIISPLTIGGPFLTIRKFKADPLQVDDLIRFGTFDANAARFLQACVVGRLNMIVSGGTGTGKTTTLNVLSSFIPAGERIVTVEDAKELQLHQDHVLCMETRPPNIEGRGAVTIRDLVKNSLRMRPDRIVVGECRAGEALDMLQAMNTGHDGSMTTVHSNSPVEAIARLETLVLMSGMELPTRAIREQIANSVDVIVQQSRFSDGSRRVSYISEVVGIDDDGFVQIEDIYRYKATGMDENNKVQGYHMATGYLPSFLNDFIILGLARPDDFF